MVEYLSEEQAVASSILAPGTKLKNAGVIQQQNATLPR